MRGESCCLQSLSNTSTLHCQLIKLQGHDELPSFLPSSSSSPPPHPPSTSSVYYTLAQRCWRVEKHGTVSAGRWSEHAPPTLSGVGLHCLSRELYTISSEPRGGWLLIGDECSQYTESAVYVSIFGCHRKKSSNNIFFKNCKEYLNFLWKLKVWLG